jgi:hypothetical protein
LRRLGFDSEVALRGDRLRGDPDVGRDRGGTATPILVVRLRPCWSVLVTATV